MARRRGGVAPYVALLVAVVVFVPAVREVVAGWIAPLADVLKDLNPFRR